ncbi:MAG TPA: 6-phosphogluconolactonase [Candidatus Methylomirabilis sp.]|jgi:6-phosphogluconolactonase|nr:6-phosphogluconolactonase [Candidatus Methylomirabilis sp.]
MRRGGLRIFPDREALSREAARRFVAAAKKAVRARGRFTVAFSGGSTPADLYCLLATSSHREGLPWDRTHVFWGDERCVPPEDPASNYGAARALLLLHVPIPAANVHRMRGEEEPVRAALAYEAELRAVFGPPAGGVPRFDLLLLGLGEDGHTASLFPGSPVLRETERLVASPFVESLSASRLTLTLPVLNAAREILVLVAGGGKAAALREALEGDRDALPIQQVRPRAGVLTWLVDAAAAELLRPRGSPPSPA